VHALAPAGAYVPIAHSVVEMAPFEPEHVRPAGLEENKEWAKESKAKTFERKNKCKKELKGEKVQENASDDQRQEKNA
jgi:hypothetical protein